MDLKSSLHAQSSAIEPQEKKKFCHLQQYEGTQEQC